MNKKNVPPKPDKNQLPDTHKVEVPRPNPEYQQKQVSAYQDSEKHIFYAEHSASIIPTPAQMMAYQDIDPSFATTIMRWAEENLQHHRKMQEKAMRNKFRENIWNNVFALAGVCVLCGTGLLFAKLGHPATGITIASATVGLAAVFVIRKAIKLPSDKGGE